MPDPILEWVAKVCGKDIGNMTFGKRDAMIVARAKDLGWDMEWTGEAWVLSKANRIVYGTLRSLCSVLIQTENEKAQP